MPSLCRSLLAATLLLAPCIAPNSTAHTGFTNSGAANVAFHVNRSSPSDLELGGNLAGLPPETTGYVTRPQLLALPHETYTVTGDPNFAGRTQISGVALEELFHYLG